MKTEYQMINSTALTALGETALNALGERVTKAKAEGWKIAGDMVSCKEIGGWEFYQPMIREIEPKPEPCKPTMTTTLQWKPIQGCYTGDANRIEAECSLGTWVIAYEPASSAYHLMKSKIYGLSSAYQASQVFFKEQEAITFCEDFTRKATGGKQ